MKTAIATTFYSAAEEKSVCKRKKSVSGNSMRNDFEASFL